MHTVIRKYKFDSSKNEYINSTITEKFLPLLKTVPGFVSYYWVSISEGQGVAVTVFESEAGTNTSTDLAAQFVKDHFVGMFEKPEITKGTVVAYL